MIEDAPAGVRAGRAAGMTVWAVTTTHTEDELEAADRTAADLAALLEPLGSPRPARARCALEGSELRLGGEVREPPGAAIPHGFRQYTQSTYESRYRRSFRCAYWTETVTAPASPLPYPAAVDVRRAGQSTGSRSPSCRRP